MKYLTNSGLSYFFNKMKIYISNALSSKANSTHTHSASDITSGLATVATSGSYNDLSNKPTIPTVNNATLTIQRNGTTVDTFTANSSTDKTVNIAIPTKTSDLTNDSNFVPSTDLATVATSGNYNDLSNKPTIPTVNNATLTIQKNGTNVQTFTANQSTNATANIIVPTKTSDLTNDSGFITEDTTKIPLAGSNQISGSLIPSTNGTVNLGSNSYRFCEGYFGNVFCGGLYGNSDSGMDMNYTIGANLILRGKDRPSEPGIFWLVADNGSNSSRLMGAPGGTLTWNGQAIQTTSDARLKQQISEIDNALLDAWSDVTPVQFKYNDAVEEKGNTARLHTGYVVQQIDEACKSHNVDISEYGLYCHEVYQEETREVEHEDGTKTIEVVRPASEHYSLRYTEVYAVECMYLRRCIARLTARIEELEKGNNVK